MLKTIALNLLLASASACLNTLANDTVARLRTVVYADGGKSFARTATVLSELRDIAGGEVRAHCNYWRGHNLCADLDVFIRTVADDIGTYEHKYDLAGWMVLRDHLDLMTQSSCPQSPDSSKYWFAELALRAGLVAEAQAVFESCSDDNGALQTLWMRPCEIARQQYGRVLKHMLLLTLCALAGN
jgi:hypothetical protein